MRIDFHQHVWTESFRDALEHRAVPPCLRGNQLLLPLGGHFTVDPSTYTAAARLHELDQAGVDAAVVSLAPTTEPTRELIQCWNDDASELAAASGGRLIPLAYRDPRPQFAGAILPAADLIDLDRSAPLLDRLEAQGQLAFVHPGPVRAEPREPWWAPGVVYVAQMQAAYASWVSAGAARWPRLRVVFALLAGGAPFQIERLLRRGLDPRAPFAPNIWLETSSYGERALELSLQTFGAGRLLFGSDAPIDSMADALSVISRFGSALESELLSSNPSTALTAEAHRWAA
jgi:predicted TIM-barrel fold metal-dependent hydrolase